MGVVIIYRVLWHYFIGPAHRGLNETLCGSVAPHDPVPEDFVNGDLNCRARRSTWKKFSKPQS